MFLALISTIEGRVPRQAMIFPYLWFCMAKCRMFSPCSVVAVVSAFAARRSANCLSEPPAAAICKGVRPLSFALLQFKPRLRSYCRTLSDLLIMAL